MRFCTKETWTESLLNMVMSGLLMGERMTYPAITISYLQDASKIITLALLKVLNYLEPISRLRISVHFHRVYKMKIVLAFSVFTIVNIVIGFGTLYSFPL
jgi:hypothetical protein